MPNTCGGCPHHTPNGECYIGTIENCKLEEKKKKEKELRCPNCGSDNIDVYDSYDTDFGENEVFDYFCGNCLDCGREFQWTKVFVFKEYRYDNNEWENY